MNCQLSLIGERNLWIRYLTAAEKGKENYISYIFLTRFLIIAIRYLGLKLYLQHLRVHCDRIQSIPLQPRHTVLPIAPTSQHEAVLVLMDEQRQQTFLCSLKRRCYPTRGSALVGLMSEVSAIVGPNQCFSCYMGTSCFHLLRWCPIPK